MARYCDEQAVVCGELEVEVGSEAHAGNNKVGRELADRVASEGGGCCVPKKKVDA